MTRNKNRTMLRTTIGTAIAAGVSAMLLPPPTMATEIQKFASMKVELRADGTPSYIDAGEMRGRLDGSAGWVERAKSVVAHFRARFGLADAKTELVHERIRTDLAGNTHVRMKQRFKGVPVEGSALTVHFDSTGEPVSITGRVARRLSLSTQADISEADAIASATQAVAEAKPNANDLWSTGAELVVYDPAALSASAGARLLAFRVTVKGPSVREFVYVDARNGAVVDRITGIQHARDRLTYDMNNGTSYVAATLERSESDGPAGDLDVDNAHDFAGDTYDFMLNAYGRDSIDDNGFTLESYTHRGIGYENAFWDGQRMTYGDGFPVDDVTGHEITHGVTELTAGLVYRNESGALNESFSDIFGEAIDMVNGAGDDSPAVRWLVGEELPGIGAIRNMSNPPAFDDPDRVTSPLYECRSWYDNGGVHINSGVPNKNFVLLTDGGSFNGRDVRAIGLTKAAAIHYQSLANYLGPNSTMRDHLIGLWQSCNDLIGVELDDPATGAPSGEIIARSDCFQVLKAGLAVELHRPVCP